MVAKIEDFVGSGRTPTMKMAIGSTLIEQVIEIVPAPHKSI